jgi:hypothetical protein
MTEQPVETLAVTFFEHPVLAARVADGTIWLSVRDLCDAVGLASASQIRRLDQHQDLHTVVCRLRVLTAGGMQEQVFLRLEYVPAWIVSVNRARASATVQQRLHFLWEFGVRHVYDAIAQAGGLPTGSSRNIEDLHDLTRLDDAMSGLAAKQQALEESQDKARQAWRDHEQRIRALEEALTERARLSNAQRGHIYQLVEIWAQARMTRDRITMSAAKATCWGAIKAKFDVAKYEHILSRDYDACVAYIRQSYERLTGGSLPGEQLDFLDRDE